MGYFKAMQLSCFSLIFHQLILAFIRGSCLQQFLLWSCNGRVFFYSSCFSYIYLLEFFLRKSRPFISSVIYLYQFGLVATHSLGENSVLSLLKFLLRLFQFWPLWPFRLALLAFWHFPTFSPPFNHFFMFRHHKNL